ncbi:FMN-dependent NADH-azoreductase [Chitinophaga agri]|uniref:FMN dependent NADH:quinone oxidoreductase n=1 Tax=Chitinophaga agri TaxID=2703787 RepID=A0A6B9ZKK7_9BACT|nr:NAD(P)H-dependent oxidoreductase [Chitinophaga agri]QHS62516.1 FMN-dependent NADH-azoreductase [Chitinophaga agri]
MKKILKIVSSVNGTASKSTKLADSIIEQLQATFPGSTVTTKDLAKEEYAHFNTAHLKAFRGVGDASEAASENADRQSDEAIKAVEAADVIVIGVPIYNFHIPSTLKSWLDHVVRNGRTFSYATGKPEGLLKDKKVYIAMTSGGVYSEGPAKQMDFAPSYLRSLLGFLGLTDVQIVRAEGCDVPGLSETALEKGLQTLVINN